MNTTKTFFAVILSFSFLGSYAQTNTDRIVFKLSSITTVVLNETDESCKISQSPTKELTAQSELFTYGAIWGWKFPKKRPLFKITYQQSNDTLYLNMPITYNFKTIGFSTYKEEITSMVQIPANKNIVVQKRTKGSVQKINYKITL